LEGIARVAASLKDICRTQSAIEAARIIAWDGERNEFRDLPRKAVETLLAVTV